MCPAFDADVLASQSLWVNSEHMTRDEIKQTLDRAILRPQNKLVRLVLDPATFCHHQTIITFYSSNVYDQHSARIIRDVPSPILWRLVDRPGALAIGPTDLYPTYGRLQIGARVNVV